MRNQTKSGFVTALKFSSQIAPAFGVFVGCLVLLGWIFDIATLKSLFPGLIEMKANTASAFLLASVSLWLLSNEQADRSHAALRRRIAQVFALLVALLGVLTLGEYLLGRDFGIDQLLFQEAAGAVGTSSPGRMAPTTAFNFILLGCALLFLDVETSRGRRPAQFLGMTAGIVAYLALTGYLFSVASFYHLAMLTGMALNTSLTFIVLSVGVVFGRPDRGLTAMVTSEGMGGLLARRFLPAVFFIPLILGWLQMEGQKAGLYRTEFGVALFATMNVVAFAALMYWASLSLEQADAERKRAEEALRRSEKWLSTTLGSIGDAVIATDQNGGVTFLNPVAQDLTGWTQEEAQGKSLDLVFDIINRETRQPVENPVKKVFRAGKVVGLADHSVLISKDGREFDIEDSAAPIVTGEGERIGVVLVFRDVTETKKTEEERNRFFNLSRDMIGIAGFDGYFKRLNPAWEKTLGFMAGELLAAPYLSFVHPDDHEATSAEAAKLATGLETISFENRYRCKDGSYKWILWSCTPSVGHQLIYAVARDITERKHLEVTLRESEQRLTLASTSGEVGVWDLDLTTDQAWRSLQHDRIFGYESLLPSWNYEVFSGHVVPEDRELVKQRFEEAFQTGRLELECRIIRADQVVRWISAKGEAFRNEQGQPIRMMGVVTDITERKKAEDVILRAKDESERKLFHAVEQSDEIIFMTALDGTITYVNPAFQKTYGFTKEEALGKTPRILKGGTLEREHYERFWNTLLSGKGVRAEFENRKKDGRLITIQASVSPVFDAQRKMMGFIAVQEDITAHKFAEEALRQSEARFRGLFENATLGIYRSTQEDRFLEVNPALVSMLGYNSQEELLAVSIADNVYANPADRERLVKEYAGANSFENVPVQWKRKDGKPISARLSGRAVRDPRGALDYFEIFVENVTERQALEKQFHAAQKFQAIGHLAGGVAHDFNNVLGAILGWAELCLDSAAEDPKLRKGLGVIIEQAQHAAGLTRQLLAFARRQHMESRVINLNNSVQEVSSLLGSVIGRDIELKTSLDPNLSSVLADPTHLEQVLMNLCLNARDAMPHGGHLIIETKNAEVDEDYCRSHPYAQPGRYVQLSVSDTGVGMDAATLDHVFEPFFTTKEQGKGTGLGLATVYGIVKQHGGFIHAYSEVGQGTTFHIYFPASTDIPLQDQKTEATALRGGDETILIAEDNEDLAALTRAALESMGYSVLRAKDGEEAVRLFELHGDRVALLVFDVVMPKLNGPDAYVKIRALRDTVPALFISGHSFESPALSSFVGRGADLLQKPYSTKALLLKVRALLDRK